MSKADELIQALMKEFRQDILIDNILPVGFGVRECSLIGIGQVQQIDSIFTRYMTNTEIMFAIVNPFARPWEANQTASRHAHSAESYINNQIRNTDIFRRLRNAGVYSRVKTHVERGLWGVGYFKHIDDFRFPEPPEITGQLHFYSRKDIPEKLNQIEELRRRILVRLVDGLYATESTIEAVRQIEDINGQLIGVPNCCKKAFIDSKRERDRFFLKFSELPEAPTFMREVYERAKSHQSEFLDSFKQVTPSIMPEQSRQPSAIPQKLEEAYKQHQLTESLVYGVFTKMVKERGLEDRLGMPLEIPLEGRTMSALQQTDGYEHAKERLIKEQDGNYTFDVEELNRMADEDLPLYLFSRWSTAVYPCRIDCPNAIEMYQKTHQALSKAYPGFGRWYRSMILSNMFRE